MKALKKHDTTGTKATGGAELTTGTEATAGTKASAARPRTSAGLRALARRRRSTRRVALLSCALMFVGVLCVAGLRRAGAQGD
ncbi:MAG TPA: hypothetical protein VGV38_19490, partial [Pyrinomonadaceae bacterium]|nr:hypothetical protein [Pyrinomonadaceae bacterium]